MNEDNRGNELTALLAGAVGAAVAAGVIKLMSDKDKREHLGKMLQKASSVGSESVNRLKDSVNDAVNLGDDKIDDAEEIVNQVMEETRKELKKRLG